jgi:muramoyltetrapeptide carboxypeptidase LdcA involved in peptidoglycan recycling
MAKMINQINIPVINSTKAMILAHFNRKKIPKPATQPKTAQIVKDVKLSDQINLFSNIQLS